jgi:8-amino-7-oxononanoate synthase
MTFGFVRQALTERTSQGLLRRRKVISDNADGVIRIDEHVCLNFASNDYLGLSQHPEVLQSYVEGLSQYGAGSTASAVVCGYMRVHQQLEDMLCELFNKEAVLLVNSGFAANQSLCQALFTSKGELKGNILCDKRMHASFIEGAMNSHAKFQRFLHNDMTHFSHRLSQSRGDTLIATEGVFSMDGDLGSISDIQRIIAQSPQREACQLMVDDAHGFGVVGPRGLGVSELDGENGENNKGIDILMATFGKAIGTGGAFIAGSSALIEYLVNFAKHYIYSTAMPPAQALATMKSIKIMQNGPQREQLHNNIASFKQLCSAQDLSITLSNTAIQPLLIGNSHKCVAASHALMSLGIYVPAIRTPTVEKGTERLRITLSAAHTARDVSALVDALCVVREQVGWGK